MQRPRSIRCFQTTGGQLTLFQQLRLWLRWWNEVETSSPIGPWPAGVTRVGATIFDGRPRDDVP